MKIPFFCLFLLLLVSVYGNVNRYEEEEDVDLSPPPPIRALVNYALPKEVLDRYEENRRIHDLFEQWYEEKRDEERREQEKNHRPDKEWKQYTIYHLNILAICAVILFVITSMCR